MQAESLRKIGAQADHIVQPVRESVVLLRWRIAQSDAPKFVKVLVAGVSGKPVMALG